MRRELLELASDLARRNRPYVVATVVWARGPTSGRPGGAAIIEPDGAVHGWIGGACAEPVVLREAARILQEGTAQLMYLGPADELDGIARDGVLTVPIACDSKGALEVFMEPVLPQPRAVIIGRSPAVKTLTSLLAALDWRPIVIDDEGEGEGLPAAAHVETSLAALERLDVEGSTPIVVATQGHYDEPALEAALATPASYIGLVASSRRAESVIGYLRDRGVKEDDLSRVVAPAGLDLGHIPHRDIAVAVLAQLVELQAKGAVGRVTATTADAPHTAIDPVCGMTVDVADARFTAVHDGQTYYFCSAGCKASFEADAGSFLGREAEEPAPHHH